MEAPINGLNTTNIPESCVNNAIEITRVHPTTVKAGTATNFIVGFDYRITKGDGNIQLFFTHNDEGDMKTAYKPGGNTPYSLKVTGPKTASGSLQVKYTPKKLSSKINFYVSADLTELDNKGEPTDKHTYDLRPLNLID